MYALLCHQSRFVFKRSCEKSILQVYLYFGGEYLFTTRDPTPLDNMEHTEDTIAKGSQSWVPHY
jgi:hypothetical protein